MAKMEGKKTTVYFSGATNQQVADLQEAGHGTLTSILAIAIDRMARDMQSADPAMATMTPVELSYMLYNSVLRVGSLADADRETMASIVDGLMERLTVYREHLHERTRDIADNL